MPANAVAIAQPWWCCVASFLLMFVDLITPEGLRISLLYPLPILWAAWKEGRIVAWTLAVGAPPIYAGLRFLVDRPPMTLINCLNWGIFTAVLLVQIELVWRGRRSLRALAEAVAKAQPPPRFAP